MSVFCLLILWLSPLWIFLVHSIATRLPYTRNLPPQKLTILVVISVSGALASLLASFEQTDGKLNRSLFTFVHALLLGHVYFHFFNMSETARRIKILLSISTGKTPQELDYSPQNLIETRLNRLLANNQIEMGNQKLRAKKTLLLYSAIMIGKIEHILFPSRSAYQR